MSEIDKATAAAAARLLIQTSFMFKSSPRSWSIHLSVATANRNTQPTVPYDWQRGNLFGVSFAPHSAMDAEAWAVNAIRTGYQPLLHIRKGGSGYCPNELRKLLTASGG
jgi:hypothetical protein